MFYTLLCFLFLFVSFGLSADCTGNKCQNGGTCVAPRQYDSICVGEYVIYGVTKGKLYAWGQWDNRVSGTENNPRLPNTIGLVNMSADVALCVGGLHNSLALDVNGNVWAWGSSYTGDFWGLQGMGPNYDEPGHPTQILVDINGNPFTNIVSIGSGNQYNIAVNKDGTVFLWGDVRFGINGAGNTTGSDIFYYRPTPVTIAAQNPGTKIIKVYGGAAAFVLADDGSMYTWGNIGGASPGWSSCVTTCGPNAAIPGKVAMPAGTAKVIDIFGGGSGTMYALTANGTLYGWGFQGKFIGTGDGSIIPTPVNLNPYHKFPAPVRQISGGIEHTLVILTDGTLWAWGSVEFAQVGNGENNNATLHIFTAVKISPDNDWYDIYASPNTGYYSFAQKNDGRIFSWGRNKGGILGNGVQPSYASDHFPGDWNIPSPQQVDPLNLQYIFTMDAWHCLQGSTDSECTGPFPKDFCTPSHCQAGGTCSLVENGENFQCNCPTNLAGLTCNISASAVVPSSGYSCSCPSGFGGQYCQTVRPPNSGVPPGTPGPTPAPSSTSSTSSASSTSSSSSTTTAGTHATSSPSSTSTTAPSTSSTTGTSAPSCTTNCPPPMTNSGTGLRGYYFSGMIVCTILFFLLF